MGRVAGLVSVPNEWEKRRVGSDMKNQKSQDGLRSVTRGSRGLGRLLLVAGVALPLAFGGALAAPAQGGSHPRGAAAVDAARQLAADKEPGTWMSAGRTYDEQRYSPLTGINKANVKTLGLAWYGDVDTERGQESTPVVVDGALYITSAWSMVKAFDAK